MRKFTDEDVVGKHFDRLTVTGLAPRTNARVPKVHVLCDCGETKIVGWYDLTSGNTRSCGCLMREESLERLRRHNAARAAKVRRANTEPDDRRIGDLARWLATAQWGRA